MLANGGLESFHHGLGPFATSDFLRMRFVDCSRLVGYESLGRRQIGGRPLARMLDEPAEPRIVEVVGHSSIVPNDLGTLAFEAAPNAVA